MKSSPQPDESLSPHSGQTSLGEAQGSAVSRREFIKWSAVAAGGMAQGQVGASPISQLAGRRATGPSVFKSRAAADYRQSLEFCGGTLTSPHTGLLTPQARSVPWQFDVLVIGSGYGAATVAARLAQHRLPSTRIGLLERGREWIPGCFPDRLPDVLQESRLNLLGPRKGTVNQPTGLFNIQQFDEITVLSGSGLGGSSLINASVTIRPEREVFEQSAWPAVYRSGTLLDPYFSLAEFELGASREPLDSSHKMIAARQVGRRLSRCGAHWEPALLTVTRTGQRPADAGVVVNRQGMLQRGCIDCGDCLLGCNVGAKNTLAMNYLPLARRAGAELYAGVEVHYVRPVEAWYEVHYQVHFDWPDGCRQSIPGCTTARMVVLGAGSLGSTEILLRSQCHGLSLSPRLGLSWSGNGDALGFVRKSELPTGIGGYSAYPTERHPVGPTIQTNLSYPDRQLASRVLIQDGAVPRAYANALGILMRNLQLDQTLVLLGMGHDGAAGQVTLDNSGSLKVAWPGLLDSPYRQLIRDEFRKVADALGGRYEYLRIFGDQMVSVHPLGGCAMADSIDQGVVNHRGQVFDIDSGAVHPDLYVIDGSIIPTSLACNPLLTITALAERAANEMIHDHRLADLFAAPSTATYG